MTIRRTIDIRFIGNKQDLEEIISSMDEWLKRDGYKIAKQPHHRQSRKEPTDTIAYTEWVKDS